MPTRKLEDVKKENTIVKDGMTASELAKTKKQLIMKPPLVLNFMEEIPFPGKDEDPDHYQERLENYVSPAEVYADLMNQANKNKVTIMNESHKWVASARMTAYLVCIIYGEVIYEVEDKEEEEKIGSVIGDNLGKISKVATIRETEGF